jgi:hypothetical protein
MIENFLDCLLGLFIAIGSPANGKLVLFRQANDISDDHLPRFHHIPHPIKRITNSVQQYPSLHLHLPTLVEQPPRIFIFILGRPVYYRELVEMSRKI